MGVRRIYESPRVTKPYTDEQWAQVLRWAKQVDRELVAGDVRLTMGGEPTFVAIADRDAREWNTDALGPTKRRLRNSSWCNRLRDEYGQGGFLHFGQGKWYPGEQLPRWALSIFWRKPTASPAGATPDWFADERKGGHNYTSEDAKTFMAALTLADKLGVTDTHVHHPGYEDTFYYLWRERRLPVNVDPFDSRLDDEMERARLRRIFEQGLGHVVGYVLPLKRSEDSTAARVATAGQTGPWFFRDERHVPHSRATRRWAGACRWTLCPG